MSVGTGAGLNAVVIAVKVVVGGIYFWPGSLMHICDPIELTKLLQPELMIGFQLRS